MLSGLILLCSLELLIVFSMYKGRLACACTFWKDILACPEKFNMVEAIYAFQNFFI